jgi:hypothetical protein
MSASRAASSPITWQYLMTVLTVGPSPQLLTVPVGTPMIVDVTFDTASPSGCGSDPLSAIYGIGFGGANSSTVNFLGYNYAAGGGIEINTMFTFCSPTPTFTNGGVRLFVGSGGVQVAPNATPIQWIPGGSLPCCISGNLFLWIPPSGWLGPAYPSGLPPAGAQGGIDFTLGGSSPALEFESTQIRLVPEPATALLLGSGLAAAAIRRRKQSRQRHSARRTAKLAHTWIRS